MSQLDLLKKFPRLKGLWLNDNPIILDNPGFESIGNSFDKLEILND